MGQFPKAKGEDTTLVQLQKASYSRKAEINFRNKRYRVFNNYVTGGAGFVYNKGWNSSLFNSALDYNFHLKANYYQLGGFLMGQDFNDHEQIQMHFGLGYRIERCKYQLSGYAGLSYLNGYNPIHLINSNGGDSTVVYHFSAIGVYFSIQTYYKLNFDYGLGFALFGDVNKTQYVIGGRIEFIFSGAYRGPDLEKKKKPRGNRSELK